MQISMHLLIKSLHYSKKVLHVSHIFEQELPFSRRNRVLFGQLNVRVFEKQCLTAKSSAIIIKNTSMCGIDLINVMLLRPCCSCPTD